MLDALATPLLDPRRFDGELDGRRVALHTLATADGRMQAAICSQGARLLQLIVPGRGGRGLDVVLGHDSLPQMLQGLPSMGAFIGRYANRIRDARFPHAGSTWQLPANDGPHCLHGGPGGSRHQVFEPVHHDPDALCLRWTFSEAGDGFPGDVDLVLWYRLVAPATLVVAYEATALRSDTVLNLTAHPFFNLEGAGHGHIGGHRLTIDAGRVLATDAQGLPTGQVLAVDATPLDLRAGCRLEDALRAATAAGLVRGFDHCWLDAAHPLDAAQPLRRLARASAPGSGVAMEVWSDAPALQFYAGGGLDGSLPRHAGKFGQIYGPGAGLCLEPQHCPDAPNHPTLPDARLRAGHTRRGHIEYRFSVEPEPHEGTDEPAHDGGSKKPR